MDSNHSWVVPIKNWYRHDLEAMRPKPYWVELGSSSTSVYVTLKPKLIKSFLCFVWQL